MKNKNIRRFALPSSSSPADAGVHFKSSRFCEAEVLVDGQILVARYLVGDGECHLVREDGDALEEIREAPFGDFFELLATAPGVISFDRLFVEARSDLTLYVDSFSGVLSGLRLATAKFARDESVQAFTRPAFMAASVEVTGDPAFDPGQMRRNPRATAQAWSNLQYSMLRLCAQG
jgi:hypothetical protein